MADDAVFVVSHGSPQAALDVVQIHDYAGIKRALGFRQGLAKQKQNKHGERDK